MDEYTNPVEEQAVQSAQDDAGLAVQDGANSQISRDETGYTALSEALGAESGSAAGAGANSKISRHEGISDEIPSDAPLDSEEAAGAGEAQDDGFKVDKGLKGRINAAVNDALAKQAQGFTAQLEQMNARLFDLQNARIGQEADAMVASGQVKDRDMTTQNPRHMPPNLMP